MSRASVAVRTTCVASGLLLALTASPAHAQFGKLKKMGADAIKDAAKEKITSDKKPETAAASAAPAAAKKSVAAPVLTTDKVALIVASLAPQLKDAIRRDAASRAMAEWAPKKKANDECMSTLGQNADPMALMANAQKNEAKITALQKQSEGANARLNKATAAGDLRAQTFLQDTVTVLMLRGALLSTSGKCTAEFTPTAILDYQITERERYAKGGSGDSAEGFDPGPSVRGGMTAYEYGLLRERIALWALMQENPALRGTGKEGVFTADETAALTAHAADIKKMSSLFKSDALIWKTWNDVKSW
ncbi:hypothetical protein [Gemmatimonas sp.]|uniref:hypothetical protein n=1 Tax=Gemmatimonas sp. TaxID=1962908 RepID=UPI0033427074